MTAGETATHFDDMYKSPIHVAEAVQAVRGLVDAEAGGVVHAPAPRTSVYEFHRDAMAGLGYDGSLVERESMPDDPTLARDRSLASDRFASLFGFEPSTVSVALDAA